LEDCCHKWQKEWLALFQQGHWPELLETVQQDLKLIELITDKLRDLDAI
jgi:hypothetical protein